MSLRSPTRLLPVERAAEAYPLELLANFLTGDFTLITEDGKTVTHRTPGSLEVKYGASSSKLNMADKDNVINYPIYKLTVGNSTKAIDDKTTVEEGHVVQTWSLAEIGALPAVGGTLSGPIIPSADKVVDLGSESMAFRNIYGSSFSGNAATATKLANEIEIRIGNTIRKFDGSSSVVWELTDIGVMSSEGGEFTGDILPANNTINIGSEEKHFHTVYADNFTGNAATATKLSTPRTLTVGDTGKSFDGSADVSWSLDEIGALPAAGGTLSGRVTPNADNTVALGTAELRFSHIYANQIWGTSEKASKLAQARQLTIGTSTKAIDWSTAVSFSLAEIGAMPASGGNLTGDMLPEENLTVNLGDETHQYKTIYGEEFTGNAASATKLKTARTFSLSGVTASSATFDGTQDVNLAITSIPAALISGVLDMSNIPSSAIERMHVVEDSTARFALTSAQVQTGDTVKETSTSLMYYVKDDTKLDSEDGYEVYKAGTAASVDWSGVQNKPTIYQPSDATPTTVGSAAGSAGTATTFARESHVHQLATSGVTAGNYGQPDNTTLAYSGTFSVPYVTVDAYGRVTAAATRTITLPAQFVPATMGGATASAAGTAGYVPAPAAGANGLYLRGDGTWATPTNTNNAMTQTVLAGTETGAYYLLSTDTSTSGDRGAYFSTSLRYTPSTNTLTANVSGNAATATRLATARTITIGSTGKNFDGTGAVSWTLAEIGAAAASHTHSYLPLTGGTLTGKLTMQTAGNVSGIAVYYSATLSTSWSGSAAPYTQAVTVSGLLATDKPVVDVVCSGTYSTDNTRTQQFCQIYRYVVAANRITAYAKTKPTVSIPIQLMVVR